MRDAVTKNISHCPAPKACVAGDYTLGDLHGNALKLLFFLLNEGIADLAERDGQTRDDLYDRFASLYSKESNDLTADDISEFNLILAQLRFRKPSQQLVRLIGDVLADRGSNDYFTLKLIQRMRQAGVNLRINLSNHDGEFIHNYLDRRHGALDPDQSRSLVGLKLLESKGLVSHAEVDAIWRECYVPAIKVFDYHIDRSQTPPKFTLFSHAPVGLETVRACAAKIGVEYDESNADALAATIDQINVYCQEHLADGDTDFLELNSGGASDPGWYSNGCAISIRHPFLRAMWNRFTGETDAHKTLGLDGFGDLEHCEKQTIDLDNRAGFSLAGVHGHEGPAATTHANRYNLDTDLGKYQADDANTTGDYVIYALAFMPRLDVVATADAALAAALPSLAPAAAAATPDAAADTDDATAPLLAQPGTAATAPSDVERAQLTAAKAAYSTAITEAGCAVGITPRHILNAFNRIVIDAADSQAQREFKEHARQELHTAWQLQIARIGNAQHRNALWHFRQFERYIREQLADAAYDPAASHTHYNLQVMKAIIDATNELGSARRTQDLIAAVNSLYNVYQQIQHDNRRWYHSIVGAPAVLRCAGSHLSAVKPAFLVHRGTPLPSHHHRPALQLRDKTRVRLGQRTSQHRLNLRQRLRRWWNQLTGHAASTTITSAATPREIASCTTALLRNPSTQSYTPDDVRRIKTELIERPPLLDHPWYQRFRYQLNANEKDALAYVCQQLGITDTRNYNQSIYVTLEQIQALRVRAANAHNADAINLTTSLAQRIAHSMYLNGAAHEPQLLAATVQAFCQSNEAVVANAIDELKRQRLMVGTTHAERADGEFNRIFLGTDGQIHFICAKRLKHMSRDAMQAAADAAVMGTDIWAGSTQKYVVVCGHFTRSGQCRISRQASGDATHGDDWHETMLTEIGYTPPAEVAAPVITCGARTKASSVEQHALELPSAAVGASSPPLTLPQTAAGRTQRQVRRTTSLGNITAATGTVGLMPAPATRTTPPEAPLQPTTATHLGVDAGGP